MLTDCIFANFFLVATLFSSSAFLISSCDAVLTVHSEKHVKLRGAIENAAVHACIDTMGSHSGGTLGLYGCHGLAPSQVTCAPAALLFHLAAISYLALVAAMLG